MPHEGLYAKGVRGRITYFTGAEYRTGPDAAEVVADTVALSPEESSHSCWPSSSASASSRWLRRPGSALSLYPSATSLAPAFSFGVRQPGGRQVAAPAAGRRVVGLGERGRDEPGVDAEPRGDRPAAAAGSVTSCS